MLRLLADEEQADIWRVSSGTAAVLGLQPMRLDAAPTTAYLMLGERCRRACAFCAQARTSQAPQSALSRVSWPAIPVAQILDAAVAAYDSERIGRACFQVTASRGTFEVARRAVARLRASSAVPICVSIAVRSVEQVRALLTDMDAPLGLTIGNALELREAIDVLRDGGPPDVRELTLALGEEMLIAVGLASRRPAARARLLEALRSGAAFEHFERMVHLQGGDTRFVTDPRRLPRASVLLEVTAPRAGHLVTVDARILGHLAVRLGAGRHRAEDPVDPAVGVELLARRGDRVEAGQPLALLHVRRGSSRAHRESWLREAASAFEVRARPAAATPLVLERVLARGRPGVAR